MSLPSPSKDNPDFHLEPIFWRDGRLFIIDQTRLPFDYHLIEIKTTEELIEAIKRLAIRGAPALGIAAAYGLVLGLQAYRSASLAEFKTQFANLAERLLTSRPTAVNIRWAVERLRKIVAASVSTSPAELWEQLSRAADLIHEEDLQRSQAMAANGLTLIPNPATLLTHCNTGSLATGGYGTALGVIFRAHQEGRRLHVYVDETRPLLQGARLTAWELKQWGIPFTLITDNMAGHVMRTCGIDAVLVGADRIARNGDTANKIGTYALAILAAHHQIPFYVVAPYSSIDANLATGQAIVIEHRPSREVTRIQDIPIAPDDWPILTPAFDITPAELITAIITEKGIYRYPYNLTEK